MDLLIKLCLFLHLEGKTRIIITRPRRWGKTLNMQMLEAFFQPDVDDIGSIQKINRNLKLFTGDQCNLKPLKIYSSRSELVNKHQGKTSVIFITFRSSIGNSIEKIKQELRNSISHAYLKHDYIYKS